MLHANGRAVRGLSLCLALTLSAGGDQVSLELRSRQYQ